MNYYITVLLSRVTSIQGKEYELRDRFTTGNDRWGPLVT